MPFFELKKGYPFPGAFTKFSVPPGPNDWQPKAWGTRGLVGATLYNLIDDDAHFIDDGVLPGDVLYITQALKNPPLATFVVTVEANFSLFITHELQPGDGVIHYKVGMKAPHTLQSLARIITARGLYAYTLHWSLVWTQVPFIDFRHDELGDLYVCHNMDE